MAHGLGSGDLGAAEASATVRAVRLLLAVQDWQRRGDLAVQDLLGNDEVREFLLVHEFEDAEWFNRERFVELVELLNAYMCIEVRTQESGETSASRVSARLMNQMEQSRYRFDRLLETTDWGV